MRIVWPESSGPSKLTSSSSFFHDRVQAAGADVLGAFVDLFGEVGDLLDGPLGEIQRDILGRHQ